jgi:hypothetical protein
VGFAAFRLTNRLDPVPHSLRSWSKYSMVVGWTEAFDRDGLLHSIRVDSGIEQRDDPAQRMAHEINRRCIDDVRERRKVKHMFGYAVERSRSPLTVTMPAEIYSVDVKFFAERSRYPVPVASVVQPPVNKDQRRLSLIAPIPEVEFQAVRVIVV